MTQDLARVLTRHKKRAMLCRLPRLKPPVRPQAGSFPEAQFYDLKDGSERFSGLTTTRFTF